MKKETELKVPFSKKVMKALEAAAKSQERTPEDLVSLMVRSVLHHDGMIKDETAYNLAGI